MSLDQKLRKEIEKFEHLNNPLHFYCRLLDMKVPHYEALKFVREKYEPIYKQIMYMITPHDI